MRNILILLVILMLFAIQGCCGTQTAYVEPEPVPEPVVVAPPTPAANPCVAAAMSKVLGAYPVGMAGKNVISLEKIAPDQVRLNEPFEYRLRVKNLTSKPLQDVVVVDTMPANLQVKAAQPKITKLDKNQAHWMLGELAANESKVITITGVATGPGSITTCGEVTYYSPTCAKIDIVDPKLKLVKYAPDESLTCDRIPLRYVISNTGSGYACDIVIRDPLSKELVTAIGQDELMFRVDTLAPGQSREFKAMLNATKAGTFASKAVASSATAGKAESNMPKTVVKSPVLAVQQTCPSDQYTGRKLTYSFAVQNKGDGVAKDAVLVVSLPGNVQFDSASHKGVYTHSSPGKVTWSLGNLMPNSTRQVTMKLMSSMIGTVSTRAQVSAYCAETVHEMCQTKLSGIPAILLEVIDITDPVQIGDEEIYVITVTNQGSATDTNISLVCEFEDSMQYVSSSGPTSGTFADAQLTLAPLGSLAAKAKAKWQVKVKAISAADTRFKVIMNSDQLTRDVQETEATHFYK